MAQNRTWTITQSDVSRTFTISPGVGQTGPAGPNNITTATETDITGILKGDGANVSAAVENTDYQGVPAEGAFIDGDKTKLDGIEAGADVTDAANVDAAGAVMESDYSPAHSVLAQQSGTGSPSAVTLGTNSLLGRASGAGTAIQGLTAAQARTLLNVEDGATADQTAAEILTAIKTVDGTGSGLDADLLDGQDSSAFATSAQGALADSAVQPGDIDTLAELNAIITDATLIDTTDSRLSDARTPTAHTHTASDLDFAGSTDIGADLADGDEILVSDGGGNTTRRKSALSRLWAYIKSKIESVGLASLDITGNLTVDTDTLQVNATTNEVTIAADLYSQAPMLVVNGFSSFDGGSGVFSVNTGTWNGSTITGDQTLSGDVTMLGDLTGGNGLIHADVADAAVGVNTTSVTAGHVFEVKGSLGSFLVNDAGNTIDMTRPGLNYIRATNAAGSLYFQQGGVTQLAMQSTGLLLNANTEINGSFDIDGGSLTFQDNGASWDGATIAGDQTFSGQVELTGQSASTDDSAMTRKLSRNDFLLQSFNEYAFHEGAKGLLDGGDSGTTGAQSSINTTRSGTAAGGWARVVLAQDPISSAGSQRASIPMAFAVVANFDVNPSATGVNRVRIYMGGNSSGAPPLADVDPLPGGYGFGCEFYWDTTNSRKEVRLFAHDNDGGGVVYGSGLAATAAGFSQTTQVVVAHDGAGNVDLWFEENLQSAPATISTTSVSSISVNAPSAAENYAGEELVIETVNDTTTAPGTSDAFCALMRGRFVLNHDLN